MFAHQVNRKLLWHGVILLLLGLLNGVVVSYFPNPRMGLSAHLTGIQNGIVMVIFGLIWPYLDLKTNQLKITYWSSILGFYVLWFSLLLAAIFGTSQATPIAGFGYQGSEWQEYLVTGLIIISSISIIGATSLLLYGLRGKYLSKDSSIT